ncbi:uncharacterized protein LOC121370076 [Gigantopelta aegis]|uniref:uncharacterized protein LOC121370076 n=1 Tax=Gigantopelta aegis TaxID=1735272 RepID=UPI001B88DD3E|nr:uncharacterized protein LOC121370076 [Gigantopelta aegis]
MPTGDFFMSRLSWTDSGHSYDTLVNLSSASHVAYTFKMVTPLWVGLGASSVTGGFGDVALTASPSGTTQAIAQEITFTLTGSNGLTKILLGELSVSTVGQTRTLCNRGCMIPKKEAYFGTHPPITYFNNHLQATVKMRVVKFINSADLTWKFIVRKCVAGDLARCADPTESDCDFSRRRRAVEQVADNSTETVNYGITVVESLQNYEDKRHSECVTTSTMTAAVVAMAVVCFILLVICLVFIVHVLSRRNRSDSKENLS